MLRLFSRKRRYDNGVIAIKSNCADFPNHVFVNIDWKKICKLTSLTSITGIVTLADNPTKVKEKEIHTNYKVAEVECCDA